MRIYTIALFVLFVGFGVVLINKKPTARIHIHLESIEIDGMFVEYVD